MTRKSISRARCSRSWCTGSFLESVYGKCQHSLRQVNMAALRVDLTKSYATVRAESTHMNGKRFTDRFPVLVLGETGTGRSLLARRFTHISHRFGGPFIAKLPAIPLTCFGKANFSGTRGVGPSLGLSLQKIGASKWLTQGHCS